jgi:hypothetical protein
MPIHIFTEAQRATLDAFPAEMTREDLSQMVSTSGPRVTTFPLIRTLGAIFFLTVRTPGRTV